MFVQPPNGTAVTTSAVVDIASVMLPTAHAVHTLRGGLQAPADVQILLAEHHFD